MEVNKEINPTVFKLKKNKKKQPEILWIYYESQCWIFGCNNLLQDFEFMKNVKIVMDVWGNERKESVYKRKIMLL